MIPKLPRGFTSPVPIGGGAFGNVYRVHQSAVNRKVAMKIIMEPDSKRRNRLLREATIQARIRLEGIPPVFDAFDKNSAVYIIMEWIPGISLRELRKLPLTWENRLQLADEIVKTVCRMHAAGYVHRDLKPENILVSASGIHLVDFGFSRAIRESRKSVVGTIKGTPAYMAPELWSASKDLDYARADNYSLGRILGELLGDPDAPVVKDLISSSPERRPAPGAETAEKWAEAWLDGAKEVAWPTLGASLASESLAEKLYEASRELLTAHREEEAYWLLIECLETHPDHAGAIDLINAFPSLVRRRKRTDRLLRTVAVCSAAVLLVTSAYFTGKERGKTIMPVSRTVFENSGEYLYDEIRSPDLGPLHFHEVSSSARHLDGAVVLAFYPDTGTLYIDGVPIPDSTDPAAPIPLPFGEHRLSWRMAEGLEVWRERVFVLPFETTGLGIPKES